MVNQHRGQGWHCAFREVTGQFSNAYLTGKTQERPTGSGFNHRNRDPKIRCGNSGSDRCSRSTRCSQPALKRFPIIRRRVPYSGNFYRARQYRHHHCFERGRTIEKSGMKAFWSESHTLPIGRRLNGGEIALREASSFARECAVVERLSTYEGRTFAYPSAICPTLPITR